MIEKIGNFCHFGKENLLVNPHNENSLESGSTDSLNGQRSSINFRTPMPTTHYKGKKQSNGQQSTVEQKVTEED